MEKIGRSMHMFNANSGSIAYSSDNETASTDSADKSDRQSTSGYSSDSSYEKKAQHQKMRSGRVSKPRDIYSPELRAARKRKAQRDDVVCTSKLARR